MISTLNPLYKPPTRHTLSNHFVPAWYNVEKQNVKSALEKASKVAITSDGWTSICQDHYLTVTAHYITQGTMQQKVLVTKAVYRAQTGDVVAEEIGDVLEEYGIREKVTAITVDNASNMDVAVRKLDIIKIGCFAHTLNLAAQTIYTLNSVAKWAAKIREVVVWMKRSAMAKVVLREKQHLLKIEKNSLLLDVKTRWNSLFLMIERFLQQYPALQAASLDPRLRKPMERDRLSKLTDEDYRKAEEFIELMEILYTSTLCASTEKSSTCGQVLPILQKLKNHFTVQDGDSEFVSCLKKKIWTDLSKRYQTDVVRNFLGEATAMDPRFKHTLEDAEEHKTVWNRINEKILAAHPAETEQLTEPGVSGEDGVGRKQTDKPRGEEESEESEDEAVSLQTSKKMKLTPLEKLFAEDDVLKLNIIKSVAAAAPAIKIRTEKELAMYKALPPTLTSEDPSAWWWRKRDVYPLLSDLALSYLCVQASSTPSERVFSTAGDTISTERSSILPEKADMLIFLFKNC